MTTTRTKRTLGLAVAAGFVLATSTTTAQAADDTLAPLHNAGSEQVVAGAYIVVLDEASSLASVDAAAAAATEAGGTVTHVYRNALKGFSAELSDAALATVRATAGVAYVEPDTRSQLDATVSATDGRQEGATWGIDRVDQRDLPLNQVYRWRHNGQGVSVYVIDTGVRFSHTEFGGRAISGPDFYDDDDDSSDCHGHGTHVSGTVAGKTYGVAKKATIVGVRTIDCGGFGDASDSTAAIDWVAGDAAGPGVINMSLRFPASQAMDDAIENAFEIGVVSAVAAGNFAQDACIESPAREPFAVTVAASDINDARAGFSNFGTCVDIFAPGVNILSAGISSDTATATMSGTSMASPHTAGGIALIYDKMPDATSQQVVDKLIAKSTKDTISNPGTGTPNRLLFTKRF